MRPPGLFLVGLIFEPHANDAVVETDDVAVFDMACEGQRLLRKRVDKFQPPRVDANERQCPRQFVEGAALA